MPTHHLSPIANFSRIMRSHRRTLLAPRGLLETRLARPYWAAEHGASAPKPLRTETLAILLLTGNRGGFESRALMALRSRSLNIHCVLASVVVRPTDAS